MLPAFSEWPQRLKPLITLILFMHNWWGKKREKQREKNYHSGIIPFLWSPRFWFNIYITGRNYSNKTAQWKSVQYLQAYRGRQGRRDEGDKLEKSIEMASKVSLPDIFPLSLFSYFLSPPPPSLSAFSFSRMSVKILATLAHILAKPGNWLWAVWVDLRNQTPEQRPSACWAHTPALK